MTAWQQYEHNMQMDTIVKRVKVHFITGFDKRYEPHIEPLARFIILMRHMLGDIGHVRYTYTMMEMAGYLGRQRDRLGKKTT